MKMAFILSYWFFFGAGASFMKWPLSKCENNNNMIAPFPPFVPRAPPNVFHNLVVYISVGQVSDFTRKPAPYHPGYKG
jgi:hypothetical protein